MSKFIVYSDSDSQSNKILGIADSGSNNLICRGKMYVGSDINHNFSSGKVLHVDGDIKFTGNLYKGNVDITTDPASGGTTNYLTLAGGGNVVGPINMNSNRITGLPSGGSGSDAARWNELPDATVYLSKTLTTPQTMAGNIAMNSKKITGLAEGGASGEAITYDQLPDASSYLSKTTGGTMSGNIDMGTTKKITGLAEGTGSDAARFQDLPVLGQYLSKTLTTSQTMSGNIDMGTTKKITGLAEGGASGEAVTYDQIPDPSNYLSIAGGTMSGDIDMGGNKIEGLPPGGSGSDAARWDELPTANDYLLIAGDTMTGDIAMGGNKITGLPSGGSGSDAARWDELPDATDYLSKTLTTSQTMSGEINMNNKRITGLAAGTGSGDAVTYDQYAALNADLDTRYKRDGSNPITGDLDLGTNTIIGIGTSNVSLPTNTAADNDYLKIKNIDNGTGVTTTEWAVAPATVNSFSVYGGTTKIQGDVSIIGAGSHTGETNAGGGYTGLVLGGSNAGGDNSAAICFQTKDSAASTYSNKMIISKRGCLSINRNSSVNKSGVKFEVKGDSYFNGRVGIGTSNPQYPLHVAAASAYQGTMDSSFVMEYQMQYSTSIGGGSNAVYTIGTTSSSNPNLGTTQYSGIDAYIGRIGCDSIYFSSDIRIKTNICDLEDDEALINLRKLKPKRYEYIDKIDRGGHSVYGFIAQDVREVFPEATRLETRHIPNIMGSGVISQNVITYYIRNTSTLTVGVNIRVMGEDLDYTTATVTEILNDKTFRVDDESLSELPDNSTVFVYGTAVDDFHVLQKDAIWTIATAALQEVDRQIQAEKVKVSSLESSMADALARITALENAN